MSGILQNRVIFQSGLYENILKQTEPQTDFKIERMTTHKTIILLEAAAITCGVCTHLHEMWYFVACVKKMWYFVACVNMVVWPQQDSALFHEIYIGDSPFNEESIKHLEPQIFNPTAKICLHVR